MRINTFLKAKNSLWVGVEVWVGRIDCWWEVNRLKSEVMGWVGRNGGAYCLFNSLMDAGTGLRGLKLILQAYFT